MLVLINDKIKGETSHLLGAEHSHVQTSRYLMYVINRVRTYRQLANAPTHVERERNRYNRIDMEI